MEQNPRASELDEGRKSPPGFLDLPREIRGMIYSYIAPLTRKDRIREYMFLRCQELLSQAGGYRLKGRSFAQIVQQLDEEKEAYEQWQEEQAHIKILMSLKPERPTWLYATPHRTMPGTRRPNLQTQKELFNFWGAKNMYDDWEREQILWQIRECAKYEMDPSPIKGNLRQLVEENRLQELFARLRADDKALCSMGWDGSRTMLYTRSFSKFWHDHFQRTLRKVEEGRPEITTGSRRWRYNKREAPSQKDLTSYIRKMRRLGRYPSEEYQPWLIF